MLNWRLFHSVTSAAGRCILRLLTTKKLYGTIQIRRPARDAKLWLSFAKLGNDKKFV